jgi:hypothetical protein
VDRPFIKGLKLSEFLYEEAVRPVLSARFPDLPHSAARLGPGSDVLGFDTPISRDHDWGPRLTLFLPSADYEQYCDELDHALSEELPREIHGYPTSFGYHDDGTTGMLEDDDGPVYHQVDIRTVRGFFTRYLNYDPSLEPSVVQWLIFPQQRLRTIASGRVFYDGLGQLGPVRARLRWYPRDVWLYMLAAQWQRISQEEPFMARCGDVGDEVGSRLIAARMVGDLMRLCFLMERQYAPYSKWFGTAFARLDCANRLLPTFEGVLRADTWQERERHLSAAYEAVAEKHNALQITGPLPTQVSRFHTRPYLVIQSSLFVDAIHAAIADERVKALPMHLGAVDQYVNSTDVLDHLGRLDRLKILYQQKPTG